MDYYDSLKRIAEETGEKPTLRWWKAGKKKGGWRKLNFADTGKNKVFFHPNTKSGYEEALHEYQLALAEASRTAEERFEDELISLFKDTFREKQDVEIPGYVVELKKNASKNNRVVSQTIGYWLQQYLADVGDWVGSRLKENSFHDRRYKVQRFRNWANLEDHITVIDNEYIKQFHKYLDSLNLTSDSKSDYFSVFRMFTTWAASREKCKLNLPSDFMAKKKFPFRVPEGKGNVRLQRASMLWTSEEFSNLLSLIPSNMRCFLLLFLNCGFRHVDVSELQHSNLRLEQGRIVYQRNKLNQLLSAPVVSYPLWKDTQIAIEENISDHPKYVFLNQRGNQVENAIKSWWKRWREKNKPLSHKRLDYLRKTGSTIVQRHNRDMDTFYLGETLKETSKLKYSFNDGSPCQELDNSIANLGFEFGFVESPPSSRISLPSDLLTALESKAKEKGIPLQEYLGQL